MPPRVGVFIIITQEFPVCFGRDDRAGAAHIEFFEHPIRVERLIGQESVEVHAIDQRLDPLYVVGLAGQENKVGKVAERIDQSNDLGGQSAARAPDGLILSPPFAPLAFW